VPELIEVEYYRRALDRVLGQDVIDVGVSPASYLRPDGEGAAQLAVLVGTTCTHTSRRGKLLLVHFAQAGEPVHTLGIRFGMTGRLLIDGTGPIERLEYSSGRNDPAWDRFRLRLANAEVVVRDQRRLGSVELDAGTDGLGFEASDVSPEDLERVLSGRTKAIKALLLDQSLLAGLGNLLADEVLWRSGIAPSRPCDELSRSDIESLAATIRHTVAELSERGGSHRGDSFSLRSVDAICPKCGSQSMVHATVGGRSTWSCRRHQR